MALEQYGLAGYQLEGIPGLDVHHRTQTLRLEWSHGQIQPAGAKAPPILDWYGFVSGLWSIWATHFTTYLIRRWSWWSVWIEDWDWWGRSWHWEYTKSNFGGETLYSRRHRRTTERSSKVLKQLWYQLAVCVFVCVCVCVCVCVIKAKYGPRVTFCRGN